MQVGRQELSEINILKSANKISCVNNKCEVQWLLDSGCTDHLINNEKYFSSVVVLNNPIDVNLPNGMKLQATKIGKVKMYFKIENNVSRVELRNVYYIKGLRLNLLSFSKITQNCSIVVQDISAKIYEKKSRKLLAVAWKRDNLYEMRDYVDDSECTSKNSKIFTNVTKPTSKEKWHRALEHVNFNYLKKLVKNTMLLGLPNYLKRQEMKCTTCFES